MTDILTETFTISGTLSATPSISVPVQSFSMGNTLSGSTVALFQAEPFVLNTTLTYSGGVVISVPVEPFSMESSLSAENVELFELSYDVVYYIFKLSGWKDGLEEVELPMTSFQTRMRSGEPTYLQVVIPGVSNASDIYNRPNGRMLVYMALKQNGELKIIENIVSADLEDIMLYQGDESDRIVLVGHRTETFQPKNLTITTSNYRNVNNGYIRHRLAEPNIYLRPGDILNIGDDTFAANVISYYISVENKTMEVGEV